MVSVGVNGRPLLHAGTGRESFLRNILSRCDRDIRMTVVIPGDSAVLRAGLPQVRFISVPERSSGRVFDRRFTEFLPPETDLVFQPDFSIPFLSGRQRLVFTIQDLSGPEYPDFRGMFTGRFPDRLSSFNMLRDNMLRRRDIHKAWRIIAVSPHIAQMTVEKYGYPGDSIHVVANGISSDFFTPADGSDVAAGLESLGLTPGGYLLYVGGMISRKNVGRLVAAYRALPAKLRMKYPLVLVGRGYWRTRLERLPLNGVVYLDYLSRGMLRTLYQGAAGAVYPSVTAGAGLPVFEAALLGAPVAASSVFASENEAAGFSRLFDPFSVFSIRDALEDLLCYPDRWRMSSAVKDRVRRDFSWSATAAGYMHIFRQGGRHGGMQEAGQSIQV